MLHIITTLVHKFCSTVVINTLFCLFSKTYSDRQVSSFFVVNRTREYFDVTRLLKTGYQGLIDKKYLPPKLFVRTDMSSTASQYVPKHYSTPPRNSRRRVTNDRLLGPRSTLYWVSSGPRYPRFAENFSAVLSEEATGTVGGGASLARGPRPVGRAIDVKCLGQSRVLALINNARISQVVVQHCQQSRNDTVLGSRWDEFLFSI